jgi:hypothetical protein
MMMDENSISLVEEIDSFSGYQLKRKEDLLTLVNLGYSNDQKELIEDLSFTSKYVQGLFRILKKGSSNSEMQNIALIKRDISGNLEKIREKIEQLIINSDDKIKEYFRGNYLRLSQNSLLNLIELMNDLEWTKKYLNHLKRKAPN